MRIDYPTLRANRLQILVSVLFALFIITLPRYTDFAKTWYVLLLLVGIFSLVFDFRQFRAITTAERVFFAVLALNFAWIAISSYFNGQAGKGSAFLWDRHVYTLFIVPMFFLFRKIRISDEALLPILFCSVAISLGDILLEIIQGIDYRAVLENRTNINGFAPIQLCLSGILLLCFNHCSKAKYRWLAMAGFACGVVAVIFSKSRSTWVTLIVLLVLYALYLTRSLPVWKRAVIALSALMLVSTAYLLPTVKSRVDQTVANVGDYVASEDYSDKSRESSVGQRLELWKAGWLIFLDNPFIGAGVGNFQQTAIANVDRFQVNKLILQHNYVHNQYFAALATRGLPGLILMLLVLVLPVYIAMRQKSSDRSEEIARLSIVLVCLVYLIGNLAEDHLETKPAIMFLSVMLPLLLARISPGQTMRNSTNNR